MVMLVNVVMSLKGKVFFLMFGLTEPVLRRQNRNLNAMSRYVSFMFVLIL